MMARNPQLGTEYKFVLKDSPNFIGVAKGEDKLRLKVNEIIAAAKAAGELDKMARSGSAARPATCRTDAAIGTRGRARLRRRPASSGRCCCAARPSRSA